MQIQSKTLPMKRDKRLAEWLRGTFKPGLHSMIEPTDAPNQMTIAIHLNLIEFVPCEEWQPFRYQLTPQGEIYIDESIPLAGNEVQDTPPASELIEDKPLGPVGHVVLEATMNANNELRQQLAESREAYRVLQSDMRQIAAENQRLRAFVAKVAMPHDNDILGAPKALFPTGWIIEARTLLDTEEV